MSGEKLSAQVGFDFDHHKLIKFLDLMEMTIKSPIPVRSGTAGSQAYNGKIYQGGGQQYELLVYFNQKYGGVDYTKYFDIKKLEIKQ